MVSSIHQAITDNRQKEWDRYEGYSGRERGGKEGSSADWEGDFWEGGKGVGGPGIAGEIGEGVYAGWAGGQAGLGGT